MGAAVLLLACLPFLTAPQADTPDAKKIGEAVKNGVDYLRAQEKACFEPSDIMNRRMFPRELVLWTLINAAVPPKDPFYKKLFDDMLTYKLESTYPVALQAMILEFLDRARFQYRIAQCA